MQNVAADTAKRDLQLALPAARHRKWALVVMSLFLIAAASLISVPEAGINALKRWLMPLSNTERYTFTKLDLSGINTPLHVPFGEAFSLTLPLAKDSEHRPATARVRYGNDAWIEAPLVDGAYTFHLPKQRAKANLRIEAEDARYSIPIEPVIRPSVNDIRAAVSLPSYLERPGYAADLRSGFITLLEGSEIKIQAISTRSLSSASANVITLPRDEDNPPSPSPQNTGETAPESSANPDTIPPPRQLTLKVDGRKITTPGIKIANHPLLIPMRWTDIYGLKADSPLKLRIETSQDQLPSTYIRGVERQHIMLAEETISFEVIAEDDYGLKSCGISWQGEFTKPTGGTPAKGELTLAQGSSTQTLLKKSFSFSPANLNIAPQKLILRSWTEDFKPGRGRIYSEPLTLYILTRDEHSQVLKNAFDQAIGELEDIARKEQNLNDENKRIDRKQNKNLQDKATKKKLEDQQHAERSNIERMQQLTKRMEKLFKDAVRNGEIDKQALQKMAKALQAMRELSQQDLPKVEKKLADAQSNRNTQKKAEKDLKDAIEEQNKALKKMKQALKDANDANRNFEASTFVNRLKRAASEEDGIASTFIDIIDKIIGSEYNELDPVEQRAIKASYDQQRQTASDVRWIQEDLAHYYARTQKDEHKKLVDAMRASRINEALEQLSLNVSGNLSFTTISQSKQWATQLRKWANVLSGDQQGGGGGGGGGGGQSQEDMDFEFMLKVMRMIQKESDIRARTRALEDLRRSLKSTHITPDKP